MSFILLLNSELEFWSLAYFFQWVDYMVPISHFKSMADTFSKDKHQLTNKSFNPVDKINFMSAEKMCSHKVIEILNNIEGSEAAISFPKTMNEAVSIFG